MSSSYIGRERNRALRALNRFDVSLVFENGNTPVYRFKPKGYATVIAEVRGRPGTHNDDVLDIGNAVRDLARVGAK
jgi:hypothetical protein